MVNSSSGEFPQHDNGADSNDADIDLSVLEELRKEKEAVQAIRRDVIDELRRNGVNIDDLDLERDETAGPEEPDLTQPPNWPAIALKTGVEVVAKAIHFGDIRLPDADIDPQAKEDTFEVKADAQMTLQDPNMPLDAYQVLNDVLNAHIPVRLDSVDREAELINKVAAEREQSSRPPGPLS